MRICARHWIRPAPDYRRVRDALYADIYPQGSYPPNTLLIISALVNPDLLLEIEAVAAI
jgi:enamine deaminase RidA (YjgF/YER057c/UK114 family)